VRSCCRGPTSFSSSGGPVGGENGKSKLLLASAVGWISLVPTVLLPFRSVAATALLPIVLRAVPTQPLGDAAGLPSNDVGAAGGAGRQPQCRGREQFHETAASDHMDSVLRFG